MKIIIRITQFLNINLKIFHDNKELGIKQKIMMCLKISISHYFFIKMAINVSKFDKTSLI